MIYAQVPIGDNFPVQLVLLPEVAEIVFVVVQPFKTIYDMSTGKIDAYFDMSGFAIAENSYSYNTSYAYKELPDMLEWLKNQNLVMN